MKLPISIEIGFLTLEERAESGRLPEVLHITDIALLLMSCSSDFIRNSDDWHRFHQIYKEPLERALRSGELRSLTGSEAKDFLGEESVSNNIGKGVIYQDKSLGLYDYTIITVGFLGAVIPNSLLPLPQQTSLIHRDDFAAWLKQEEKWPLPEECLLSEWWPEANIPSKPTCNTRRTRINELHEVIWATYLGLAEKHLTEPTSGEIWLELKRELGRDLRKYDKEEIIQEITEGTIHWNDSDGSKHTLTKGSLKTILTRIKKDRKK